MRRCLQLAKQGLGTTYPNPLVGSVIVHNRKIIGEGWHKIAGGPHAEIVAINSTRHGNLLKNSTLYVNLEPCSHFGKTPPCSHRIVEMGIPRVVVGCRDFASHVNGKGIQYLRDHGVEVVEGVLEEESKEINKRFFAYHTSKRPYIILKYAQTVNGFFAPIDNKQKWITGKFAKQLVHKWRTEEQAILVGRKTAQIDKPRLNARLWNGNQPIRILISPKLDETVESFIDSESPTLIYSSHTNHSKESDQIININFKKNVIQQILKVMYNRGIQSVIIEGGVTTLNHFIENNLWDEARVFTGAVAWDNGLEAPLLENADLISSDKVGDDSLHIYKNSSL